MKLSLLVLAFVSLISTAATEQPEDDSMNASEDAMNPSEDAMDPSEDAMDPSEDAMDPPEDAMDPSEDAMDPSDVSGATPSANDPSSNPYGDISAPENIDDPTIMQGFNDNPKPEVEQAQTEASLTVLAGFTKNLLMHTDQVAKLNGVTLESVVDLPESSDVEKQKREEKVLRDVIYSLVGYGDLAMNGLEAMLRATEVEQVNDVAEQLKDAFEYEN